MSAPRVHRFTVTLSAATGISFQADVVATIQDGEVTIESVTLGDLPVETTPEQEEIIKTLAIPTL